MYCRYVINKINHRTNCYQGILVTLGTMLHNNEFNAELKSEVEALFEKLKKVLPTPPGMDSEKFRKSLAWFKTTSVNFDSCMLQVEAALNILRSLGHEVLLLQTDRLENVLYEDSDQVVVQSEVNAFTISPF